MSHGDIETLEYDEGTTPLYEANLVDLDDQGVSGQALDTIVCTLYQEYTREIINGRDKQNVSQANGVTIDDTGLLQWYLSPEDTVILDDELHQEPHIALFEYSYAGPAGTEYGKKEVRVLVTNLSKVP